jgi:hypothetical protein
MFISVDNREYFVSKETCDKVINLITGGNPIRTYVAEHPRVYGDFKVEIIEFKKQSLVQIPLPVCNIDWTVAAFHYIEELIKISRKNNLKAYPQHGYGATGIPKKNCLYFYFEE